MSVFKLGTKLFSHKMNSDGEWEPQILLPAPDSSRRSKRYGIRRALRVPSPFRSPPKIKAAMDSLLRVGGHLADVSEDGKGVTLDPLHMMKECIEKAEADDNLRRRSGFRIR
eukprot:6182447-Pleurochrysis_carterae.AAC.1